MQDLTYSSENIYDLVKSLAVVLTFNIHIYMLVFGLIHQKQSYVKSCIVYVALV